MKRLEGVIPPEGEKLSGWCTRSNRVRVHVDASAQWRDRPLREEGENNPANKGIHSVPEAASAATSIPSLPLNLPSTLPSHTPSLFLRGFIILCHYQPGQLNGPNLLNFMPQVNLVPLMATAELRWRCLAPFYFPLGPRGLGVVEGTEINLQEQYAASRRRQEEEVHK